MAEKCWLFLDFVDSDGENVIHGWLHSLPKGARLRINTVISFLEATPPPLRAPYVKRLKGPCDGLMELRVTHNNIQYRPLACYGPGEREVTLLIGAEEHGGKLDPQSACETALSRKRLIHEREEATREHQFD